MTFSLSLWLQPIIATNTHSYCFVHLFRLCSHVSWLDIKFQDSIWPFKCKLLLRYKQCFSFVATGILPYLNRKYINVQHDKKAAYAFWRLISLLSSCRRRTCTWLNCNIFSVFKWLTVGDVRELLCYFRCYQNEVLLKIFFYDPNNFRRFVMQLGLWRLLSIRTLF